jgi:predicted dehydrogenase
MGCGYDADLPFQWDEPRSSTRTFSHARALACHPGFELVAGVDPCHAARDRFTALYRCPAFSDLAQWLSFMKGTGPELVVFAVPPQLQPSLVEELLQWTVPRVLLLEKPVAVTLEQANALEMTFARHPGLIIAVNYIRRYLPVVQSWETRLQKRFLGRLLFGHIVYGKGIISNGSHFVNLVEAWLGSMQLNQISEVGMNCLGFDREAQLLLHVTRHCDAPVFVRSIGEAGLRAGEIDLWFERGRLCWQNNGKVIQSWSRCPPLPGDCYASLSSHPMVDATGIEHYQHDVLENLHAVLTKTAAEPACSFASAQRTFKLLEPAVASSPMP